MNIQTISKSRIKELRDLGRSSGAREQTQTVLIEGYRALQGAIASGAQIIEIFVDEHNLEKIQKLDLILPIQIIDSSSIERIVTTSSSQGVFALAKYPKYSKEDIQNTKSNIFVLDNINDPGNMGTIIRSCAAFGVESLVLLNGSDPYNPKVIRSSAGTIFGLTIYSALEHELEELFDDFKLYATMLDGKIRLDQISREQRSGFIFGNEANGIQTPYFIDNATPVTIDMQELCESLNVAMAATIVAYELYR